MLAIQTKYVGPTNYRGSRIIAVVAEEKNSLNTTVRRLTVNVDHALNSDQNHAIAAKALIERLGWAVANGYGPWVIGSTPAGYVFVCDTKHGHDRMVV